MATPHNAAKIGEIAKTVLLPGDPLRAKVIADTFLEDPVQFNAVRNMFGFTGTYKGKAVSVMGTGMGIPSIGIYSHELIHVYGAQNLIRIGSCGAITDRVKIGDIVMAQGACTDSNYAYQYGLHGTFSAIADFGLLSAAVDAAKAHGFPYAVGNVNSTDIFYNELPTWKDWAKMGCLASEMETYALYCNAARAGVRALGIFTVSDSLVTGEETTAQERQNNFTNMMEVALDVAAQL
ncbi:MAG: purine-nucleoside phosphorylase [Eubacteriales bacterium]|nr:purine-nucleoside phosphorylase [Lachnospiraceae bacterium]MDO4416839.1 purine-nucleoside phosphorylase [Eubacteriales bacterium]